MSVTEHTIFPTSATILNGVDQTVVQPVTPLQAVTERVAEVAKPVANQIGSITSQAVEKLCSHSAKLDMAQQRLLQDCQTYVRAKPLASVGVAAAAGFLLALLFRAR